MQSRSNLNLKTAERFVEIVGERHALRQPGEIAPFLTEERGLYRGRSPMVLRPGSVEEVAAICRLATQAGVALVAQGGNTGLVGGQTPLSGEIVLSLGRLDRIQGVDIRSNIMTCEAGVVLATAQQAAADCDRLFPLSLASEGSATIGGVIATNAGGTTALAFGVARDLVRGLEVVLADGRILNTLSKLRKDNTGYDLSNLFIGSEGTLGIVTAASLKLFPKPRQVQTALLGLPSPEAALALFDHLHSHVGGALTSFELIARWPLEFALAHGHGLRDPLADRHAWYVLLELSWITDGQAALIEQLLAAALERGWAADAVLAASSTQRSALWRLREFIPEAQKLEGSAIKHDISVPVAAIPSFLHEATAAVTALAPGARSCPFGHLGDGNIHFNISQPPRTAASAFLARADEITEAVHGIAVRLGGSISAEHGIGALKRDELARVKQPVAMDLMRQVKRLLDPAGIFGPGKVLPAEPPSEP